MKTLIFIISCFLTVAILNAEDVEKPAVTKAAVVVKSSSPAKVAMGRNVVKGKIKAEISTLRELRRIQNMKTVELKKSQNKEIEALEKNADFENSHKFRKARKKMKSEHKKVLRELKAMHKKNQKEFKKDRQVKQDFKKEKRSKGKKKEGVK